MGDSDFSLFELHVGRPSRADDADTGGRESTAGDDGAGRWRKAAIGVGALIATGALAAVAWYLRRRWRDRRGDRAYASSATGAADRRRSTGPVAAGAGGAGPDVAGTASLLGLSFLVASSAAVRRYVVDPESSDLASTDADENDVGENGTGEDGTGEDDRDADAVG